MAMTPAVAAEGPGAARLIGDWSGPQIHLVVNEAGGRLDLGCGTAGLASPIHPDAAGNFSVSAHYETFSGGPTQADVPPKLDTVRLNGRVEGDTLRLSIDHGGGTAPEAHTLQRGRRGKIIPCN